MVIPYPHPVLNDELNIRARTEAARKFPKLQQVATSGYKTGHIAALIFIITILNQVNC